MSLLESSDDCESDDNTCTHTEGVDPIDYSLRALYSKVCNEVGFYSLYQKTHAPCDQIMIMS